MKILHIISGLDYGGAEKLLLNTCREQLCMGDSVKVVFFKGKGLLVNEFEALGINTEKINVSYSNIPFSLVKLVFFIRKQKYDVVHTHLASAAFIGRLAALIAGTATIVNTLHNTDRWISGKNLPCFLLKQVDKLLNNTKKSKIIAISEAVREFLVSNEKGIDNSNIYLVYNAINFSEIDRKLCEPLKRQDVNLNKDDFIIINIGRMDKQKNQIMLLKAVKFLVYEKGLYNIKCLIMGNDGNMKNDLLKYVRQNNLDGNVFLTGPQPNPFKYLKISDLFVMPSLYEGLPLSVLEAYYCAVPVLSTEADGLSEIVKHNVTGIKLKRNDHVHLANEILRFYRKEYDIEGMVNNARAYVQGYDIKSYANNLKKVYMDEKQE